MTTHYPQIVEIGYKRARISDSQTEIVRALAIREKASNSTRYILMKEIFPIPLRELQGDGNGNPIVHDYDNDMIKDGVGGTYQVASTKNNRSIATVGSLRSAFLDCSLGPDNIDWRRTDRNLKIPGLRNALMGADRSRVERAEAKARLGTSERKAERYLSGIEEAQL